MPTTYMRNLYTAALACALVVASPLHAADVTPAEARIIAKDAFIYGAPFVEGYKILYKQAVDHSDEAFVAPFNTIGHSTRVATPQDKQFVTPNSDTPYSYLWMDLRAEPVVITMPKIDKDRYYTAQLKNPLKLDPMMIKDIKVAETIKEGKTIYLAQY